VNLDAKINKSQELMPNEHQNLYLKFNSNSSLFALRIAVASFLWVIELVEMRAIKRYNGKPDTLSLKRDKG